MTSSSANKTVDETIAGSQGPGTATVLSSETLQQWQSELDDFVTRTRRQLNSLSRKLADCQPSSQQEATGVVAEPTHAPAMNRMEVESVAVAASVITASVVEAPHAIAAVAEEAMAETADDRTNSSGAVKDGPAEVQASRGDADPLDRLSAIKLRLAKQIEDAS